MRPLATRCLTGVALALAPLMASAASQAPADWPAAFDVLLLLIVFGSVAYLLYDLRAARRSREARKARDELWNTRTGYHRRYPAASTRKS